MVNVASYSIRKVRGDRLASPLNGVLRRVFLICTYTDDDRIEILQQLYY